MREIIGCLSIPLLLLLFIGSIWLPVHLFGMLREKMKWRNAIDKIELVGYDEEEVAGAFQEKRKAYGDNVEFVLVESGTIDHQELLYTETYKVVGKPEPGR